jgi:alpha-amylase/alpha-mannosidase (GH57 family)
MNRYICIHGHFYQPPRENPWLNAISLQESAYPFHDWNERIHAECYSPNTHARILDEKGSVTEAVNNYSRISYNFGPTLLSWMEAKAPDTYQAILDADKISREKFSGHGSAMAQCHSHMIMPLANSRDKYTQIYWGIRDFEFRFKRLPEGMWLPETAVDLETLQIMADLGIRFTILAPHQAGNLLDQCEKVEGDNKLDIYRPYRINLSAGNSINIFFYHGSLSQSLAFDNLLQDGKSFAEKLMWTDNNDGPQLLSIATDGETYGHHHKFGDMALAFALKYIDNHIEANLTNFAEYLELFPPEHEIKIIENTSWSCVHGVERWNSHCGCETGGHHDWNQNWRTPLRRALDWLQGRLISVFLEAGKDLIKDPWETRDRYIDICINRCNRDTFLSGLSQLELQESEKTTVLKLLEMQRYSMLMYTSCGWFFNDISGIETEQILLYAGKAIQLAEELSEEVFEPQFIKLLELAESNIPEKGNGAMIYKNVIKEATIDFQD